MGAFPANCEIASVLFLDLVGYSLQSIDRQTAFLSVLQKCVRASTAFEKARSADALISLPTGDGMALVFLRDPVAPVHCALDLARTLQAHPELRIRMGVHIGPVQRHADIKDEINLVGGGINMAQRVMDFGDAGHILLSHNIVEVLEQFDEWRGSLHDLGVHEAKHGITVHLYTLYHGGLGNPEIPRKLAAKVGSDQAASPTSRSEERALDVAIAREIPVFEAAELVVLLRCLTSPGLRGILEVDQDYAVTPDDVRSKPLTLEFPLDRKGAPEPLSLTLHIDSPDFEPKSQSKVIRIPPQGDSAPYTFLLTPQQLGDLRINVQLYKQEITLLARSLKTSARPSERIPAVVPQSVLTIPLFVMVQAPAATMSEAAVVPPGEFTRLFQTAAETLPSAEPARAVQPRDQTPPPAEFTRMMQAAKQRNLEAAQASVPAERPAASVAIPPAFVLKSAAPPPIDRKKPFWLFSSPGGIRATVLAVLICGISIGTFQMYRATNRVDSPAPEISVTGPSDNPGPSKTAGGPSPPVIEAPAEITKAPPVEPPSKQVPVVATPIPPAKTKSAPGVPATVAWEGEVKGIQVVTIRKDKVNAGNLTGSLPGTPCVIRGVEPANWTLLETPASANDFGVLTFRLEGSGRMRVAFTCSPR